MPIIDNSLQNHYNEMLLEENAKREALHEPSGKLTASTLYQPLRFQLLKCIGAPRKPMEPYVLGKFQRGDEVEKTVVKVADHMGILLEQQKLVHYRDVIGFADMVVDTEKTPFKRGIMPYEVKSVTNAKLKRIEKTGVDYHYQLQACLYAMSDEIHSDYYGVVIASGEDNRMTPYIYQTADLAADVNMIISKYQAALDLWKNRRILPKFEPNPKVPWTANPAYAMFEPFWFGAPDEEVLKKLEELGLLNKTAEVISHEEIVPTEGALQDSFRTNA